MRGSFSDLDTNYPALSHKKEIITKEATFRRIGITKAGKCCEYSSAMKMTMRKTAPFLGILQLYGAPAQVAGQIAMWFDLPISP